MTSTPMVVTARMSEPVAYCGDGMHLDGILAYAAYLDMDEASRAALPYIGDEWAIDMDVPLDTWSIESLQPADVDDRLFRDSPTHLPDGRKRGYLWGWRASAVHAIWRGRSRHEVRKRPAVEEMVELSSSPSVVIKGGRYRASDVPYQTMIASSLTWYAVGNIDKVRRIIQRVRSIGKLSHHGLGVVSRWEVAEFDDDWSVRRDGKLTRRMPGGGVLGSIRPPYHHRSRLAMCDEPDFERLEPREEGA